MTRAVRIHATGAPDKLRWEEQELHPPGPGEVQLVHTAIGVNYSDINVRRGGFYPGYAVVFPLVPGNEAAGVVETIGPGVSGFAPGDRVAYAGMHGEFFETTGSYAERRNVPFARLVRIPDGVSDRQAAAVLLKGLTASLIIKRLFRPQPGDAVLVHAAASGVGSLLVQWCKQLGATVIGTAGSPDKAALAASHGCDHTILYREVDFVPAVQRFAPQGVAAVLDGVGKDTFLRSIGCVRPFGMAVNYGNASGPVPPFDLLVLIRRSVQVCRPGIGSYIRDPAAMRAAADELLSMVASGAVRATVGATYALREAAAAHAAIESRDVSGSVLLLP